MSGPSRYTQVGDGTRWGAHPQSRERWGSGVWQGSCPSGRRGVAIRRRRAVQRSLLCQDNCCRLWASFLQRLSVGEGSAPLSLGPLWVPMSPFPQAGPSLLSQLPASPGASPPAALDVSVGNVMLASAAGTLPSFCGHTTPTGPDLRGLWLQSPFWASSILAPH